MKKDNEQILENAKLGNSTALLELFKMYQPVILRLKQKYFLKDLDYDDWLQEGRIVMYQSLKSFSSEKGVSFGKFFKTNLERRMCSLLRKQNAAKRAGEATCYSLEEKIENQGENFYIREELMVSDRYRSVFIRNRLEGFHHQLSEFESTIFRYFIKGKTIEQIATQLNVEESKVKNALDRRKRKLKNFLFSE